MNLEKIKEELLLVDYTKGIKKDILIVVHDQFKYIKNCIDSIYKNTKKFNLYIWDNASKNETSSYLKKIAKENKNIKLYYSDENVGFIIPNNKMIQDTQNPYIILLNSDTMVDRYWDSVMIGFLEKNKDVAIVGYDGGILNHEGRGIEKGKGYEIDYVCGYCMCFSRDTYENFGLFDDNLKFAYCEDADFALRVRSKNKKIYACYSSNLVHHFANKTTIQVLKENDFSKHVKNNMNYIKNKWSSFLSNKAEGKAKFTDDQV